ncbi:uncharacterized protein TRAVEDRAFT_66160 [Trametes versicolor FP-101664 SS1]|uniref:uncharacterized protein n=1 Tax=Trametes versicolor (strain FP-101664) TaxID=717944 RepID=UPI000462272A|nr:uncharacterized protein TRAVEDRAFT_66160 [Trametes versicolor FP-101664 SS1]EIW56001.1 hypothetical protein TRAVEDRAFT_66160 [Trametes versicolor FP-101664 SS1]
MSPKRKTGGASKPSAQPKPVATTSKPPATTPSVPPAPTKIAQTPSAGPAAPNMQRVSPPPNAGPSRPGVTIQTNPVAPPPRSLAQPPKPSAQPARSALASHLRNAPAAAHISAPAAKPGPAQKHTFTRSDRVRAEWREFEATWVSVRQSQIERELDELFKTAERTSRAKGKTNGAPSGMDKIVNGMQRDFAYAARDEWDARLLRAGLQAEDWTDMSLQEMIAVEQVLSYEDVDQEPGVYAQVRRESVATTSSSGSSAAVDTTPPTAPRSLGGWKTSSSAYPQSAAPQKTHASQPLRNTQSVASRHAMFAEDEPVKPSHTWGGKTSPIIEDTRTQSKPSPAPIPVAASASASSSRAAHPPVKPAPTVGALATSADLLVYAVPIALTQPPLDPVLAANADYISILDKLNLNSIRQFHLKAADADAELARQLRKPMPAADREFTIRAHQVAMEQSARDIVTRRNQLLDDERKKRGWGTGGPGGDSAPTVQPAPARPAQVPGAFPEERPQPVRQPSPELKPLLEYVPDAEPEPEREPEEEVVDEVIEIPIKGKGKKKGKGVAVKPAANGRSTPTPAAPTPAARAATPTQKAAPAAEAKGKAAETKGKAAPTIAAWNSARTAPARAASPAPINTKLSPTSSTTGRSSPIPIPPPNKLSPWEAQKAKSSGTSSSAADAKAAAADQDIWAPPMARGGSNSKNPFAPTRPSRLAQVSQGPDPEPVPQSPESPEPPSPPVQEQGGQEYMKWYAGSPADDDSILNVRREQDEDEEEDEDEDDEETPGAEGFGFGSMYKSLAGASPWALFGESSQPARTASPAPAARGRAAQPTPARAVAPEPAYARWGAPPAGPSGFGAGPSAEPSGMWKPQGGDDPFEQMHEIASSTLDRAVAGSSRTGIEDVMAMYVTASKARETAATPVGGRSAWRR